MNEDTVRRFRRAYRRALHDLDVARLRQWEQSRVTLPQLRVLYQIRRQPGITTRELARLLGVSVSTVSGLVIKLADRGLVERTVAAGDRRQIPLQLTAAGAALAGELSDGERSFVREVARLVGPALDEITAALERLGDAADRALATEAHLADADDDELGPTAATG